MNQTATQNSQLQSGLEVLPGYVLKEKIGEGGFGEVWSADAPGGLLKAIKFIYGNLQDSRARQELEALDQIKQLRHPFLISTERVEIVNETLLMVLELAEGNLKERFEICRANGRTGIPSDELIQHLGDAADALDFLWESHHLQHLDIKPDNLMLSGGRTKIGDFGLIRQINEDDDTLLGGITPIYAPPEVFDGKPCGLSDQYSLAIAFQELLTGQLPFRGRTAAQLAMQHVHQPPALESMPMAFRSSIRRALAKDPQQRFPNCRSMIDALKESNKPRSAPITVNRAKTCESVRQLLSGVHENAIKSPSATASTDAGLDIEETAKQPVVASTQILSTETHGDAQTGPAADIGSTQVSNTPLGQSPEEVKIKLLPALNASPSIDAPTRPVLLIGVGGIGLRTIAEFKQQVSCEQSWKSVKADIRILGIDTDDSAIRGAASGEYGAPLDTEELFRLSLRGPSEYRDQNRGRFSSMAKRWVYNVPRSYTTQRMRPFGRLAFVDHYQRLCERLKDSFPDNFFASSESTSANDVPPNLQTPTRQSQDALSPSIDSTSPISLSSDSTSANFNDQATSTASHPKDESQNRLPPLVILTGAICGGTASGILNELAFLVRGELAEHGDENIEIMGVVSLHSGENDLNQDLEAANAITYLAELLALRTSGGGYPGDSGAAIPPNTRNGGPFDWLYLCSVDEDADGETEASTAKHLADFAQLNIRSASQHLLHASRRVEPLPLDSPDRIRAIGLARTAQQSVVSNRLKINILCRELLARWLPNQSPKGAINPSDQEKINQWTRKSLGLLSRSTSDISNWLKSQLLQRLSIEEQQLIGRCVKNSIHRTLGQEDALEAKELFEQLLKQIDSAFRSTVANNDRQNAMTFSDAVHEICQPLITESIKSTNEWIQSLVDTVAVRIKGGVYAFDTSHLILNQGLEETKAAIENTRSKTETIRDSIYTEVVCYTAGRINPSKVPMNPDNRTTQMKRKRQKPSPA